MPQSHGSLCFALLVAGLSLPLPAASAWAGSDDLSPRNLVDRLLDLPADQAIALALMQDAPQDPPSISPFRSSSTFKVRPQVWLPEFEGDLGLQDSFGFSTIVDFASDLGVDDPDSNFAWDLRFQLGPTFLRVSGFSIDSSSLETANQAITFGDISVLVGELIDTELQIENFKVQLGFTLFNLEDHGLNLAFSIGLDVYQIDVSIVDVADLVSDEIDEELLIPIVGVHVELPLGDFLLTADASGFSIEVSGVEVDYFDADISLTWMPINNVGIFAGYRLIEVDLKDTGDFAFDATMKGPFFGVEIRF